MDKDTINILVLGHTTFGIRRLSVKKESLRIATYLVLFFQFAITFFLCDYIQVRKKTFLLNQLRQESQVQKSHIQLFTAKINELEKKLSGLKEIDQKIRVIANLERGPETLPFIGMGGSSFSVTRAKSVSRGRSAEEPKPEKTKIQESKRPEPRRPEPKETESKQEADPALSPMDPPLESTLEAQ